MNTFKILPIAFLLLAAGTARAENWQKIVSCENGAVAVEVNTDERRNLQLVVRGDDLLGRLYRAGMIGLQYGQQEYLLRGDHSELRQTSDTETSPVSLGGVFNSRDFRKMIWQDWNGNAIEVERRGSDLFFKRLSYTQGTSCNNPTEYGCGDPDGSPIGPHHRTYHFQKEYILRGCSVQ